MCFPTKPHKVKLFAPGAVATKSLHIIAYGVGRDGHQPLARFATMARFFSWLPFKPTESAASHQRTIHAVTRCLVHTRLTLSDQEPFVGKPVIVVMKQFGQPTTRSETTFAYPRRHEFVSRSRGSHATTFWRTQQPSFPMKPRLFPGQPTCSEVRIGFAGKKTTWSLRDPEKMVQYLKPWGQCPTFLGVVMETAGPLGLGPFAQQSRRKAFHWALYQLSSLDRAHVEKHHVHLGLSRQHFARYVEDFLGSKKICGLRLLFPFVFYVCFFVEGGIRWFFGY